MNSGDEVALVYTVCASEDEALMISRTLVRAGLAACTNLWPITSVYTWEAELVEDRETAMLVKTVRTQVATVFEQITALHSYELPCLLQLSPDAVEPVYARWIRDGSRKEVTAEHAAVANPSTHSG